jgi:hypothetical protein
MGFYVEILYGFGTEGCFPAYKGGWSAKLTRCLHLNNSMEHSSQETYSHNLPFHYRVHKALPTVRISNRFDTVHNLTPNSLKFDVELSSFVPADLPSVFVMSNNLSKSDAVSSF